MSPNIAVPCAIESNAHYVTRRVRVASGDNQIQLDLCRQQMLPFVRRAPRGLKHQGPCRLERLSPSINRREIQKALAARCDVSTILVTRSFFLHRPSQCNSREGWSGSPRHRAVSGGYLTKSLDHHFDILGGFAPRRVGDKQPYPCGLTGIRIADSD
jgi:hypothetical protein